MASAHLPPDATYEQKVDVLVDRAAVSDLLIEFAYCLDTRDWDGYAALYEPEGRLVLPFNDADGTPAGHAGTVGMADYVSSHLGRFGGTHHLSANHRIAFESADVARTRSYGQFIHRISDADPTDYWEIGGWYDCLIVRGADGAWRFREVRLSASWQNRMSPIEGH